MDSISKSIFANIPYMQTTIEMWILVVIIKGVLNADQTTIKGSHNEPPDSLNLSNDLT